MAWPAFGGTAAYDRTKQTEGRAVDAELHAMLCAKSQLIDAIKVGERVDEPRVEWVSANTNSRILTEASSGSTTIDGHATNATLVVSSAAGLQEGALIRNATRATPIGTYKVDELMQVTAISTNTLTVTRDYGRNNSGNGSTVHALADTFEVIASPKEEGSSPDENKYKATTLSENYTSILDFYLIVSGTELARRPVIAADNFKRQYADRMIELKNDLGQMLLYGALNYGGGTAATEAVHADSAGTDAYVRTTKGLLQALAQSGGNTDYTSTAVTEDALNSLFESILNDGCDRSERYAIITHPAHSRVISNFGSDKVRVERVDKAWGRYLTTFISDLGFEAEIIADPLCSKSNLFVANMDKFELVPFRPWETQEWGIDTSNPDGTDARKLRVLGEYTCRVIDPLKAHAAMTLLDWPS